MAALSLIIHIVSVFIVLLLMAVVYPLTGLNQRKLIKAGHYERITSRVSWYYKSILWSWIPTIIIFVGLLLAGTEFSSLGFRAPSAQNNNVNNLLYKLSLLGSALYALYSLYCSISFIFFEKIRRAYLKMIPHRLRFILPHNSKEKRVWVLLSLTAGVTEEFLYRGYIFFIIPYLTRCSSPIVLIISSSILFAVGHIYQGKEVIKPAVAGLILSIIYYCTGSIYIVILLHSLQDIVAGGLIKQNRNNYV